MHKLHDIYKLLVTYTPRDTMFSANYSSTFKKLGNKYLVANKRVFYCINPQKTELILFTKANGLRNTGCRTQRK